MGVTNRVIIEVKYVLHAKHLEYLALTKHATSGSFYYLKMSLRSCKRKIHFIFLISHSIYFSGQVHYFPTTSKTSTFSSHFLFFLKYPVQLPFSPPVVYPHSLLSSHVCTRTSLVTSSFLNFKNFSVTSGNSLLISGSNVKESRS